MTTDTKTLEAHSLKSLLKGVNVNIHNDIVKSLTDKTVVGFYCVASSLLRKSTTVRNIQQFITENKLPLVVEAGNDSNPGFKVMIIEPSSISDMKIQLSLASNYLSMAEVCELNMKKGKDVKWWQEKKEKCLILFQEISKAI